MEKSTVIELKNVCFNYRSDRRLLNDVSFKVTEGELVGIIGPSGEGKTTLIRLLNSAIIKEAELDYKGDIIIKNKDLRDFKDINRYVGTVYQNPDDQLVFTSVFDELVFGMENYNYHKDQMYDQVQRVLKLLNIESIKNKDPNHLSGGEKQLIVLACVLCLDVDILLLDEAFAAVDESRSQNILDIILSLKKLGKTIIMIEHDYSHLKHADRVFRLHGGELTPVSLKEMKVT